MRTLQGRRQGHDVFVGGQCLPHVGQDGVGRGLPLVAELADGLENLPTRGFQVALKLRGLLHALAHRRLARGNIGAGQQADDVGRFGRGGEADDLLRSQRRLYPVGGLGGE